MSPASPAKPCVLVAAGRAPWEPSVLAALSDAGMVVLSRCVDLVDLLATASAGTADVAVIAAGLDGVDTAALRTLQVDGVGVVAVGGSGQERSRLARLAVPTVDDPADVDAVVDAVRTRLATPEGAAVDRQSPVPAAGAEDPAPRGRVVAVWGAAGAPGRSTVASALAAQRATSTRVVLCDVDPWAGTLAQGLGVVDRVSGLLAAARAANEGDLDEDSLRTSLRSVSPGLDLLTGLPRADRWIEVRPGIVESVVTLAARAADVVLDCGFGVDPGEALTPGPGRLNAEALSLADRIVVVGSAEPVALARLARALVELGAAVGPGPPGDRPAVVINRMRASLGWRTDDIAAMVAEIAPSARVSFWPYERAALDRAALKGVAVPELGETPLRDCARALVSELFEAGAQVPNSR